MIDKPQYKQQLKYDNSEQFQEGPGCANGMTILEEIRKRLTLILCSSSALGL
jgi:hypothetical protein